MVGTQAEIQYAAGGVHAPGQNFIVYTLQQQTVTAEIIMVWLAGLVRCCLLYALYGSIDSSVVLRLGPKLLHTVAIAVWCWYLLYVRAAAAVLLHCSLLYCVLLAIRKRLRRAAACYTYSRATCCRLLHALVIPNEI